MTTVTAPSAEDRVLDAARRCVDRWGLSKLTIDDVAAEAGVSRATLYRLFPGGKDVMFDALRRRLPTMRITGEPAMLQSAFINGIKRMPCAW